MVVFPAHTTTALQPLDRGVFYLFKLFLDRKNRARAKKGLAQAREQLLNAAASAWHCATAPDSVAAAWAATRLVPWNPDELLASDKLNDNPPPAPSKRFSINARVANRQLLEELTAHIAQRGNKSGAENSTAAGPAPNPGPVCTASRVVPV